MSTIRVKVTLGAVLLDVNKEDYKDQWQERQEEAGNVEEGEDAGEPTNDFVLECVQEELENSPEIWEDQLADASIDDVQLAG